MGDRFRVVKPEHGRLRFTSSVSKVKSQESPSPYVVVPREPWESQASDLLADVWERWGMDRRNPPKLIISVTGGAVAFDVNQRLIDDLKLCLFKVATTEGINAWIITGGTYTGIMKLVGDAYGEHYKLQRSSGGVQPFVLGIAMYDYVKQKEELIKPTSPERTVCCEYGNAQDDSMLDPHHTHFILVEDSKLFKQHLRGGEIKFRTEFTKALMKKAAYTAQKPQLKGAAKWKHLVQKHLFHRRQTLSSTAQAARSRGNDCNGTRHIPVESVNNSRPSTQTTKKALDVPVVTLVLEGGPGTVKTALEAVRAKTPIIVFAGSGRAANLFVKIYDRVRAGTPSVKDQFTDLKLLAKTLYPDNVLIDDNNKDTNIEDEVLKDICEMTAKENWHLVNVYRYNGEHINDIDEAILKATLRALKKAGHQLNFDVWKRCMELAVAWNLCAVAKKKLLNDYNRPHWKTLDRSDMEELLLNVLVGNQHEFASLFMDLGVDFGAFLQKKPLSSIYEKTLNARKTNNINVHLVQINGARKLNQVSPACLGGVPIEFTGSFNYTAVLNKLTSNLYMPTAAADCSGGNFAVTDPYRELFVWSVSFNRMEMAKVFWKKCPQPIGAALFANKLLMSLAEQAEKSKEFHLCRELTNNAREYEVMAMSVLDICHSRDPEQTRILMERKLEFWGHRTLLATANLSGQMDFIASDCCQLHVDDIWRGQIAKGTHHFKILVGCVFPFLVIYSCFIDIEKDPRDEDSIEDTESNKEPAEKRDHKLEHDGFRRLYHFLSAPVTKFCYNSASYLVLLGLYSYFLMLDLRPNRFPNVAEVLVLVWTVSLLLELIRQCVRLEIQSKRPPKIRVNFSDIWNRIRLLMYVMTIVGFVLARCLKNDVDYEHARNVYCIAVIMYYLCVLQLYFVHKELGPKVVIVLHMLKDIVIFLFLLAVFVFAFGVVAQSLMYPNSVASWRILVNVLYVPYYTLYQQFIPYTTLMGQATQCSSDYSVYSKDYSRPQCSNYSWLINVIYAVYILLVVIMLLNILIAIFSNTFKDVHRQNEKTWSFYRYSLTAEYHDKSMFAPPLIILSQVYWFYCWVRDYSPQQKEASSRKVDDELATFESIGIQSYFSDVLLGKKYSSRSDAIDNQLNQLESRLSKKLKRKHHDKRKSRNSKKYSTQLEDFDENLNSLRRNRSTFVGGNSSSSFDRLVVEELS